MRVIYTAGCWDLFHEGHLRILRASRALGDRLVVGVVTDDGAARYKPRPLVQPEAFRLDLVSSLDCVDAAFLQPGTDPTPVLRSLAALGAAPTVMTHGDDWDRLLEGNETLEQMGIELVLLPYGDGSGTTGLVERIRAQVPPLVPEDGGHGAF